MSRIRTKDKGFPKTRVCTRFRMRSEVLNISLVIFSPFFSSPEKSAGGGMQVAIKYVTKDDLPLLTISVSLLLSFKPDKKVISRSND